MDKKLPKSMEEMIKNVREKLGNEKKLGDMFEKCFTNTLDFSHIFNHFFH